MSRYCKVSTRMWGDEWFRSLSAPQPNAQTLWTYLLTGPHTNNAIPGLFMVGEAGMAEALGWPLKGFREAFQEVFAKGKAKADWNARVVWLPKALAYNAPESPNVVRSWGKFFSELPECALKAEAFRSLKVFIEGLSKGFREAFQEAFAEPLANHEHEHEHEHEQTSSSAPEAPEAAEVSTPGQKHVKEGLEWGTPEALVALYHELTKLPRVTLPLSPARTAKAKDYLNRFPAREFWVGAFTEIGQSTFLSGRRRGPGHEHFKVDFDWLLTKGKADQVENIMKVFEGKYRDAAAQGAQMPHLWSCVACGITHKGTEAQAQAKVCLKGVA